MAVSTARAALGGLEIGALDPTGYEAAIPSLAALIVDAVEGGASVNFMAGVSEAEAAQWWQARIPDVADGTITAFVAKEPATATIVGSTILIRSRALADGRWLLILDTEAGSAADTFYRSLGWQVLGTMPNHAYRSDGQLAPTTYFWKDVREKDRRGPDPARDPR
jgi:hypothetical protein